MTEYKEFKLDVQIWENYEWNSDYCLDIDLTKDRDEFRNFIDDTRRDEFEVIIKIKPKISDGCDE